MNRLLSSALVFLLVAQCALSMVIPEERNKREAESDEVEMVAGQIYTLPYLQLGQL